MGVRALPRCRLGLEDYCEDPAAAPLTDAGLTPHHAVRRSWSKLPPGSTAVVVGVGGLGHVGVQILEATTAADEVFIATTYWGSRPELVEVLDPGARGLRTPQVTMFGLDDHAEVHRRLAEGTVDGRAVLVP